MPGNTSILIVEDEKPIARFIQMELEHEGYDCGIEYNGAAALDRICQERFDLILLDIMLPDIDGLSICKRTRELSNVPIMMLSARDDIETKVYSLDSGANDYLTKPFNSKELFARIRALLRERRQLENQERYLHLREMTVFVDRHEAVIGPRKIRFSKTEFELLVYLIVNKNIVLSRSRILEEVWGYGFAGDTNLVDVYIRYLRGKLGPDYRNYIRTVRGVGYVAED